MKSNNRILQNHQRLPHPLTGTSKLRKLQYEFRTGCAEDRLKQCAVGQFATDRLIERAQKLKTNFVENPFGVSMKLSLSVRIVEAPCKTKLFVPFEELVAIARETGYEAVCLRASAGGVDTPKSRLAEMRRCVESAGLFFSMVTADFNVPLNNDRGPDSLRNIGPSLDVAEAVGCSLIRVCLKQQSDIPFARQAAFEAAKRGIRLAHQCHTTSLFEEVEPMLKVISEIDQPNFGLIYEPANLLLNGQSYGLDTLQKLRPHLMNVYVQNHRLNPAGAVELPTFCRGNVRFDHLDPWTPGGVDFDAVTSALKQIGYTGTFTIHQAQGIQSANDARHFARQCAEYFRSLVTDQVWRTR
jgi:sugar phosphate isomerase/epimerase